MDYLNSAEGLVIVINGYSTDSLCCSFHPVLLSNIFILFLSVVSGTALMDHLISVGLK